MAATSKRELLNVAEKEYGVLIRILADFPVSIQLKKDEEDTSPKDVVGHRAHWIDLFLGWYRDGQVGRKVHFPAKGYKWNETKRYNSDLRSRQSDLSWTDALVLLEVRHLELLALIENLSEDDLYGAPMKGGNNKWTTGRWAEAAGPSHYRSATKYLRQRIRTADKQQKPTL